MKPLCWYLVFLAAFAALLGCNARSDASAPTAPPTTVATLPSAVPDVSPTNVVAQHTPAPPPRALPSPTPEPATPTMLPTLAPTPTLQVAALPFGYPIGYAGRAPGDGFFIRHGFTTENTWYNPGFWHTGEDWYLLNGETGGAPVLAVADGVVVYAGSNYPGRVVIVEHATASGPLYSMYAHLDFALGVGEGQAVARGQVLGTVLLRGDGVPSHLHFEIRDFLLHPEVNGSAPRYTFRCGPNCPPGPGYWPIDAPELPTALGWRVPAHVILAQPSILPGKLVVAAQPLTPVLPLYSAPPAGNGQPLGRELALTPGTTYSLLEVWAGPVDSTGSSATAYEVWYRVALPDSGEGWVQAMRPWDFETGSDGRASSVRVDLLFVE